MARKRMIDPSIWTDEGMADLEHIEQLLYIGLFSLADDAGRLKGSPTYLKLALPIVVGDLSTDAIRNHLDRVLTVMQKLQKYVVEDTEYLFFANYKQWQKIDRPQESRLPCPNSTNIRRTLDEPSANARRPFVTNRIEEKGIEQKRKEQNSPPEIPFEDFWQVYPRKENKKRSRELWAAMSVKDQRSALDRLPLFLPQYAADDPQFIPMPTTWINGRRWEDEPKPVGVPKKNGKVDMFAVARKLREQESQDETVIEAKWSSR